MEIDPTIVADAFRGLSHLPSDFDADAEGKHLYELVSGVLADFLQQYDDPRPEGAGGSGLVISAVYRPFGGRRAVKIPRKRIFESAKGEFGLDDPELHALTKLSHQNITRLYDHHELGPGRGYCMITEYVETPKALDEFAVALCCAPECRDNDYVRACAFRTLATLIHSVVEALVYMHDRAHLIHFDLKPDNILVSATGWPYITDLGFARDVTKYVGDQLVSVGFTWKYAHPSLSDPYRGGRVTQTPAKSKNSLLGTELTPAYDLFAFGRTLQETLFRIEDVCGGGVYSDYTFTYLHIVACLCLDGHNARTAQTSASAASLPTPPCKCRQPSSKHINSRASRKF